MQLLKNTAINFGEVALRVNESSKIRKSYARDAVKYIAMLRDIAVVIENEIIGVTEADKKHHDYFSDIRNTFDCIRCCLDSQKKLLSELVAKSALQSDKADSLKNNIAGLEKVLTASLVNLEEIIAGGNLLILKDRCVIQRKKNQKEMLNALEQLALKILADADNAVKGSAENLTRSLQFAEKFNLIDELISSCSIDKLESLRCEAAAGLETALMVHKSSVSQYEFSAQVHEQTDHLFSESAEVQKLIAEKHVLFENTLQTITVLTVQIALELKQYSIMGRMALPADDGKSVSDDIRIINAFNLLTDIADEDIAGLTSQSYDMTDSIRHNNEVETKTVSMTKTEVEYYSRIKEIVSDMTAAAVYPVEGSAKNAENAQILEKEIRSIVLAMK